MRAKHSVVSVDQEDLHIFWGTLGGHCRHSILVCRPVNQISLPSFVDWQHGAAIVAAAVGISTSQANEEVMKLSEDPANWAMPTGDFANTRYSKLDEINADNVGDLRVAWTFSTGVLRGHEGGPLVIGDGNMYIHSPFPNRVYSLDLSEEGRINWLYEPKQDPSVIPVMCCDTVNRGLSYGDGKIFLYQADATLV